MFEVDTNSPDALATRINPLKNVVRPFLVTCQCYTFLSATPTIITNGHHRGIAHGLDRETHAGGRARKGRAPTTVGERTFATVTSHVIVGHGRGHAVDAPCLTSGGSKAVACCCRILFTSQSCLLTNRVEGRP